MRFLEGYIGSPEHLEFLARARKRLADLRRTGDFNQFLDELNAEAENIEKREKIGQHDER